MSNAAVRYDAELGSNAGLEQDRLTEVIRSELARQISQTAENTSPRNVTVDVEILAYREPNEALALLLADSSQIVGNVKVLDAESGATLGEYYIEVTEGTSGLIGLALSDTNEIGLGREFVEQFMKHLNERPTS